MFDKTCFKGAHCCMLFSSFGVLRNRELDRQGRRALNEMLVHLKINNKTFQDKVPHAYLISEGILEIFTYIHLNSVHSPSKQSDQCDICRNLFQISSISYSWLGPWMTQLMKYINTHRMIDRRGKDEWRGIHGAARSISLDPGLPAQRASSPNHLLTWSETAI